MAHSVIFAGLDVHAARTHAAQLEVATGELSVVRLAGGSDAVWARATRAATKTVPDVDLGYGDPRGLASLREVLAEYLGRVRGVSCHPNDIVICNGVSHGVSLIARVLADRGCAVIAVEDPGPPRMREQIAWAGARPDLIEVDGEGLRVEELAASAAGAVITTPAHQYPTGVVLSARRRRSLADWANADGGYVTEDDYDAECTATSLSTCAASGYLEAISSAAALRAGRTRRGQAARYQQSAAFTGAR
jgi:DNA-binding transcriptional MocR family regulator